MKQEIWKPIPGYDGYEVSSFGRVKSLSYRKTKKPNLLKQQTDRKGYLFVGLPGKQERVHRLVALAFIPLEEGKEYINHKDENRKNNHVENLEWCTTKYNLEYNNLRIRIGEKHKVPVLQYSANGDLLNKFDCLLSAEKYLNIKGASTPICRCCKGKKKSAYGYIWKYAD